MFLRSAVSGNTCLGIATTCNHACMLGGKQIILNAKNDLSKTPSLPCLSYNCIIMRAGFLFLSVPARWESGEARGQVLHDEQLRDDHHGGGYFLPIKADGNGHVRHGRGAGAHSRFLEWVLKRRRGRGRWMCYTIGCIQLVHLNRRFCPRCRYLHRHSASAYKCSLCSSLFSR